MRTTFALMPATYTQGDSG